MRDFTPYNIQEYIFNIIQCNSVNGYKRSQRTHVSYPLSLHLQIISFKSLLKTNEYPAKRFFAKNNIYHAPIINIRKSFSAKNMNNPYHRQGLYEIKAIIRDAFKKGTLAEIRTLCSYDCCRITQLDTGGFYLSWNKKKPVPMQKVTVQLLDSSAKYEFITDKYEPLMSGGRCHLYMHYPDELLVTQRRRYHRMLLNYRGHYHCYGKFNDGLGYQFQIKDIAQGGCALVTNDSERARTLFGSTLRNAELNFGDAGKLIADLSVVHSSKIKTICGDGVDDSTWHLACKFKRPNEAMQRKLEDIIIKLVLEEKRFQRM